MIQMKNNTYNTLQMINTLEIGQVATSNSVQTSVIKTIDGYYWTFKDSLKPWKLFTLDSETFTFEWVIKNI